MALKTDCFMNTESMQFFMEMGKCKKYCSKVYGQQVLYVLEISFLCSPRLHLFNKKRVKKSNIVKYYKKNYITVVHLNIKIKCIYLMQS